MTEERFTFIEHLEELRRAIIKSFVFILASTIVVYTFKDKIFASMVKSFGRTLVFIAPHEAFVSGIKIALIGGLYLASPFVVYELWHFIAEGIEEGKRSGVALFGLCSLILFILGSALGYFVIVPIGIKFLLTIASDSIVPMISVGSYVSFVTVLTLVFGIIFQLPMLMFFLSRIGIVSSKLLSEKRKYAIVIIFIVAAVFTPPDVITQCLMAVPLLFLYELSILILKLTCR
jgi:sec-independent protein translocase protein TatC